VQRFEEKHDDTTKTEYRAFRDSSFGISHDVEQKVLAHVFKTSEEAENFKGWLEQHAFLNLNGENELRIELQPENDDDLVFVVSLPEKILDALLGDGYYLNDAINSLYVTFIDAIKHNQIEKMLLLLETPVFVANAKRILGEVTDHDGNNLLQIAILKLNEANLKTFLAKLPPAALQDAMLEKNLELKSAIDLAIIKKSNAAFEALLPHMNTATIHTAAGNSAELLTHVLQTQKPAIAAGFFKHYPFDNQAIVLSRRSALEIADYLLHDRSWQDGQLMKQAFALAGEIIAPICHDFWLDGNEISATLQQCILETPIKHELAEEKALANYAPTTNSALAREGKLNAVLTHRGSVISLHELNNPAILDKLRAEGIASLQDYRLLRKVQSHFPKLSSILDQLYYSGFAFSDFNPLEEKVDPSYAEIKAIFDSEDALLQRMDLIELPHFHEQMEDYNYRAKVRKPVIQGNLTHKFDHLSQQIVEYKPKRRAKENMRGQTKKMPMVHITSQLNNAVSGENDTDSTSIYLLHDKKHCTVKAMLSKSHKTRDRNWVGSFDDAEEYAATFGLTSKSDFESFNSEAKANPHQLNKVLAKTTREAVRAIVIPVDSTLSRMTARITAHAMKQHGEPLPIVFYDRALRKIRPYLPEEQEKDNRVSLPDALIQAAERMNEADFISYFNSLPKDLIGSSSIHQVNSQSVLQCLAAKPSMINAFLMVANALSAAEREVGLLIQTDSFGYNALQTALQVHANAASPLLDTVRPQALQATLAHRTASGESYLHIAAKTLNEANFIHLLSRLHENDDRAVISTALTQSNNANGVTVLYQVASAQTPAAFDALLSYASADSINAACKIGVGGNLNIAEMVIELRSSPAKTIRLLNTLNNDTIDALFYQNNQQAASVNRLCNNIIWSAEWQNGECISKLLQHPKLGATLLDAITAHWVDGNEISLTVLLSTQAYLKTLPRGSLSEQQLELDMYVHPESEGKAWLEAHPHILMTSKNNRINLAGKRQDTLELIWKEGLSSWTDYRILRQQKQILGMKHLTDALMNGNCVRSGFHMPYQAGVLPADLVRKTDAQARLMTLEQDIQGKHLVRFSLFRSYEPPATIAAVSAIIQQAHEAKMDWSQAYEAAEKIMTNEASKAKPWARNQDTQDFYVEEVKKVFNRR
jgi:hypothetical protein